MEAPPTQLGKKATEGKAHRKQNKIEARCFNLIWIRLWWCGDGQIMMKTLYIMEINKLKKVHVVPTFYSREPSPCDELERV